MRSKIIPSLLLVAVLAGCKPEVKHHHLLLPVYGVTFPGVRIVGPALWARELANLSGVTGAWYAAPDPAARRPFERAYVARYASAPPALADLAFDAASLARVLV